MNTGPAKTFLSTSEAYNIILDEHDAAITYSSQTTRRLLMEIDRTLLSHDWRRLRDLVGQFISQDESTYRSMSFRGFWTHAFLILNRADELPSVNRYRFAHDPFDPSLWAVMAYTALSIKSTKASLAVVEKSRTVGVKGALVDWTEAFALILAGRADKVLTLAEQPGWEPLHGACSHKALALAVIGRRDEAISLVNKLRENHGRMNVVLAWALQEAGDAEGAEAAFRIIDSGPLGQIELMVLITSMGGRIPFHLTWTPNFATRLREAGAELVQVELPGR